MKEDEEGSNKKPKRHYKSKKNSDVVNFPILLRQDVFSPKQYNELLTAPIVVARIVIKILNDLSDDQFLASKQPSQLQLFEKHFLTEDNSTASFTYHIKDLDKHRDYKNIEKGLIFLENLDKKWQKSVNSEGKTVKTLGGFIVNPAYTAGKVTFRMTAFWIQKLLNLGVYNPQYFQTAFKLRDMKQWLFYLWLCEVKSNSTRITLDNFNKTYGYNYKSAADACKETLRPSYAKSFDKYANLSFTCKPDGHLIYIFPYVPKKTEGLELTPKTQSKQAITQKLAHWKRQHNLDKYHIDKLRFFISSDATSFPLFVKAYESLKEKCKEGPKEKRIKTTFYQKDAFFKELQKHINQVYSKSAFSVMLPNGQPQIIDNE